MKAPSDNSSVTQAEPDPTAHAQAPQAPGGAPSGVAELGNTATHGCNGDRDTGNASTKVLWQGIDTLELSYRGLLRERYEGELARLKELAQSEDRRSEARAQLEVGSRIFEVADRGGGRIFSYLLRHPDMRVALARRTVRRVASFTRAKLNERPSHALLASVTFLNEYLIQVGPERAAADAHALLSEVGELDGAETVSRCDLAVDLDTDIDIGGWPARDWVTHAENIDPHYQGRVFTGWSIGLGAALSLRLYEKLLEIHRKSGKTYLFKLWEEAGWFYGDPVRRLEFQLRRLLLHEFGLKSLKDVLRARPGLWAYATREWTRLTVPNTEDQSNSRWPTHPWWERVQAIKWDGEIRTLSRDRPKYGAPSDKTLARMAKAIATSVMARDNLPTLPIAFNKLGELVMGELQQVGDWEGASAEDLLNEAVALKRRKFCTGLNKS